MLPQPKSIRRNQTASSSRYLWELGFPHDGTWKVTVTWGDHSESLPVTVKLPDSAALLASAVAGSEDARDQLMLWLKRGNKSTRVLDGPAWRRVLLDMLASPDPDVRWQALAYHRDLDPEDLPVVLAQNPSGSHVRESTRLSARRDLLRRGATPRDLSTTAGLVDRLLQKEPVPNEVLRRALHHPDPRVWRYARPTLDQRRWVADMMLHRLRDSEQCVRAYYVLLDLFFYDWMDEQDVMARASDFQDGRLADRWTRWMERYGIHLEDPIFVKDRWVHRLMVRPY